MTSSYQADLVVIGGGGAGLPAALSALEAGLKKVIVLEKRSATGGNAVFANGIFACESPVQRLNMIDVPKDEVYKKALDWHRYDRVHPRILRTYINRTGDTVGWLMKKGIEFEIGPQHRMMFDQEITWHVPGGEGELGRFAHVMKVLLAEIKEKGGELFLKTAAKKILTDDAGQVRGVLAVKDGEEIEIEANSVILAPGGFVGNKELLKKYFSYYDESFGGFFVPMQGDGVAMAEEAGAALEDYATMIRETCYSSDKPKETALTVAAREPNSIWVNKKGRRFISETAGFKLQPATNALHMQPEKVAFTLFDESMVEDVLANGWILPRAPSMEVDPNYRELLQAAAKEGKWAAKADRWEDIAAWIGCPVETLQATIDEYNAFCDRGYDATFVKDPRYLQPLRTGPFYAVKFRSLLIETVGPLRVDEAMEVQKKDYTPVPGFFACGSIASGWVSNDYCGDYLFGSALAFAINSGRIAGENAARYVQAR
jgi:fumarate reductase flavoprotein subunit